MTTNDPGDLSGTLGTVTTMNLDNFLDELEGCAPIVARAKVAVVLMLREAELLSPVMVAVMVTGGAVVDAMVV